VVKVIHGKYRFLCSGNMNEIKSVVLIGSGNVATHLGKICLEKGIKIVQVYSLNADHAQLLAQKTGSTATDNLQHINQAADLYIIAVKDDAIQELNAGLKLGNKIVVHTSGTAGLNAIQDISSRTGVFYPLQTFTKTRSLAWENIPVCIESSEQETLTILKDFAAKLTSQVFEIDSATRSRVHLAAVFANNFTNYLLDRANNIIGEELPFNILKPLVQETIEKAFDIGPEKAQTGPAVRDDMKTIDAQIRKLENHPEALELYLIFTALIHKKYHKGW
jgi:predicted short-subunit dehydrogenase-like oxidoreductase (DUF2520 family)